MDVEEAVLQMELLGSRSVETACSFCWLRGRTPPAGQGCGSARLRLQAGGTLRHLPAGIPAAAEPCAALEHRLSGLPAERPGCAGRILCGLRIRDYSLHTVTYHIKNTCIPGFVGSAVVEARLALPLLELWNALLSFAPYGGIGIKTTLGMGGVSVEPLVLPQKLR